MDALRGLFWNCRDAAKTQLSRLLHFMASPVQDPSLLHFVVRTLHEDPCHQEILRLIPSADENDAK